MSVRKLTTKLVALLAVITGGAWASAQEPDLPGADAFEFDPNFSWFEPIYDADILDMKPKKRAHTGYFGTYDKLHLYGKRPDQFEETPATGDEYKLDSGSGHRYEIGYMHPDKEEGMLFSYSEYDVYAADVTRIDRINRLNPDSLTGDSEFVFGGTRFGLPVLTEDSNVIGTGRRFYEPGQSLNIMDVESFELMKTWRMEPYHYGGILEPMAGVRFVQADDSAFRRRYSRTREDVLPATVGLGLQPFIGDLGVFDEAIEVLNEQIGEFENEIYTIQAGFRYFKFANRFRYSTEFRVFTGLNLQCFRTFTQETVTTYDGFETGAEVESNIVSSTPDQIERNEEFFIGYEVRAELGYQLTKMLHIRGGVQLIDLAMGIGRTARTAEDAGAAPNPGIFRGDLDQNFLAVGGTFGIELNR